MSPFDWGAGLDRDITGLELVTCRSDLCHLGVGIETLVCDGVPPRVLPFVYMTLLLEEVLSSP